MHNHNNNKKLILLVTSVNLVLTNPEAAYELSAGIATSQEEFRVGQGKMLQTLKME